MRTLSVILLSFVIGCGSSSPSNQLTPSVSVGGTNNTSVTQNSGETTGSSQGTGGASLIITTGGNPNNGGNNAIDTSTITDPHTIGGGSSQDFAPGGGSSIDVGSGGGSSIDFATGGAWTIDVPTGGGSSIDIVTGGGSSVDMSTGGGSSVDMPTGGGTSIDLATGGAPSIDLGCQTTTLTNINVYVIKDATPTGADSEGNMYVGGNLTTSSYSIGKKDIIDCTQYALVVRGDITGALVYGGKAISGGTVADSIDQDCGFVRGVMPVDFDLLENQVNNLSTSLAALPTNGTISGALMLTGTNATLNVFNITAAQLNTTQVNVNFPAGSSVVVNVSGTSISWVNGSVCLNGQCSDSSQADYVLWNMYEATSVYMTGIAIEGSVLAPLATLKGDGGHISGQIIVKYLTGGLEYHPYYFAGCLKY